MPSRARRRPRPPHCGGMDAGPGDRGRPAGRARRSGRYAPRLSCSSPRSRASIARSSCSRRLSARRPRARRFSRRSIAGSRGRHASGRDTSEHSSTPAPRSSWPRSSTTTSFDRALGQCTRSSAGSSATQVRRSSPRRRTTSRARRRSAARPGGDVRARQHPRAGLEEGRGRRAVRARAPGVARARRASKRPRTLGPRLGRVLGRALGAGRSHAEHAHDISIQYGLEVPQDHLPIAVVAVHRGEFELAREHSQRALAAGRRAVRALPATAHGGPGPRRLWSGGSPTARRGSAGRTNRQRRSGGVSPASVGGPPTMSKCCSSLGRVEDARGILEAWESGRRPAPPRMGARPRVAMSRSGRGRVGISIGRPCFSAGGRETRGRRRSLRTCARPSRTRRLEDATGRRPQPAPRSGPRSAASTGLAPTTWVEQAHHELGSIGGRKREAGLTPPNTASQPWLPKAGRTGKSPRRSFSGSGPWPATSLTCTPSSACARGPSWRAGCGDEIATEQSLDVLTFPARRPGPMVEGMPSNWSAMKGLTLSRRFERSPV